MAETRSRWSASHTASVPMRNASGSIRRHRPADLVVHLLRCAAPQQERRALLGQRFIVGLLLPRVERSIDRGSIGVDGEGVGEDQRHARPGLRDSSRSRSRRRATVRRCARGRCPARPSPKDGRREIVPRRARPRLGRFRHSPDSRTRSRGRRRPKWRAVARHTDLSDPTPCRNTIGRHRRLAGLRDADRASRHVVITRPIAP